MGVTGLWRLIEPSGKPVPLETLENKVLAIDISIWLHQAIKGFQDSQGGPLPNAHLLGVYHRVCKLLYFRIKPVFVFDGGVPHLKRETISKRQQLKSRKLNEAERLQKHLITTLLKHSAVNQVLSETARASLASKANLPKSSIPKAKETEDIYKLPPSDFDSTLSSDEETTDTSDFSPAKQWDLHTIDEKSPHFKALPADVRHEILTELKETRKQNSWGRIHEMPKQSGDFSGFQMKRLLKRYSVQVSLEEAEKEMGGRTLSLAELEQLLTEQGVDIQSDVGRRIASDENTRYLLIKDVKKAMDEAKTVKEIMESEENSENSKGSNEHSKGSSEDSNIFEFQQDLKKAIELSNEKTTEDVSSKNPDTEFQEDLKMAIELSLQDMPSTSEESGKKRKLNFSFLQGFTDADFMSSGESDEEICSPKNLKKLESAKSYMMEYSGLTLNEITKIIDTNAGTRKSKVNLKNIRNSKNSTETNGSVSSNIEERIRHSIGKQNKNILLPVQEEATEEMNLESSKELEENCLKMASSEFGDKKENEINEPVEIMSDDSDDLVSVEDQTIESSKQSKEKVLDVNNINSTDKKEAIVNKTSNQEINGAMEDDSDDSNDFLEVSSEENIKYRDQESHKNNKPVIEVTINPTDALEDDIFGDIFTDKQENKSSNELENVGIKISEDKNDKLAKNEVIKDKQERAETPHLPESKGESKNENNKAEAKKTEKQEIEKLTEKQLKAIELNLREETAALAAERESKERTAANLTDQIYQEVQELLQIFGIPYVVAPMEAEAQCAFLELINLTNGTITDDSDIWLFGGKTVYKNFFNMNKRVMEYQADDIQRHFKLTREQMILLALLVGSDYTVGLQGIGPVTALEVLAAFPPSKQPLPLTVKLSHDQLISGLSEFRKWLMEGKAVGPGRTALRNKLRNVTTNESFPSLQVVKAYLEPTVDASHDPFSWGTLDVPGLIAFARQKFGWTQSKSEEILKPVLKRLKESRTQKSIKDYFHTKHKLLSGDVENKMSKRVKRAVKKIGNIPGEDEEQPKKKRTTKGSAQTKSKNKRAKTTAKTSDESKSDDLLNIPECSADEDLATLAQVQIDSKKKVEVINKEITNEIEKQLNAKPKPTDLHKKETIPQRERDKIDALRSKLKAIETFRKSRKGPGYVKKRNVGLRQSKEDAGLSESDSD